MKYSINDLLKSPFKKIKRISEEEYEYWSAIDLYKLLEYSEYRHFLPVIDKVKEALKNINKEIENHIEDMLNIIQIGSGADRELDSLKLSRLACYIAVQNADSTKPNVAMGQAYFAIKTRQKELLEEEEKLLIQSEEDSKRLLLREQMREHNKQLADAAKGAGINDSINYAIFQNHGYKGLYGGLDRQDILDKKA